MLPICMIHIACVLGLLSLVIGAMGAVLQTKLLMNMDSTLRPAMNYSVHKECL
jgi:hypothetical protein